MKPAKKLPARQPSTATAARRAPLPKSFRVIAARLGKRRAQLRALKKCRAVINASHRLEELYRNQLSAARVRGGVLKPQT